MPASYISGQPSYARRHPTSWASWQRTQPTLFLAHRAMKPAHLLHPALIDSLGGNARQLKSRHRLVPAAQLTVHLTTTKYVRRTGRINNGMRSGWYFHPWHRHHPPGMALPRTAWVRLNRLRTGVGRFSSCLYKWGMACSAACELAQKNKPSTMLFSNVQSVDLLMTARPGGSGRWGNRMAAQHLPRDLVRPSRIRNRSKDEEKV